MRGAYRKARFSGKMVDGKVTKSHKSSIIKPETLFVSLFCNTPLLSQCLMQPTNKAHRRICIHVRQSFVYEMAVSPVCAFFIN